MIKITEGSWTDVVRGLTNCLQMDTHRTGNPHYRDERHLSYFDKMGAIRDEALALLQRAQTEGKAWVIFTHGRSTSRPGQITSRSVIRQLIQSSEATPYVVRSKCIQHESVFVAAIRERA